jgi:OOP family OmpA-OmpF porin
LKFKLLTLSIVLTKVLLAQNLILNPGFEKMNQCLEHEVFCSVQAWTHTTQVLVRCEDDPELNSKPLRGRGMMSVLMGRPESSSQTRDYLQAPILCPLIKGEMYKLRFYVKPEYFIVPEIGVYFSKEVVEQSKSVSLKVYPFARFNEIIFVENRKAGNGWVQVDCQFMATGDERYLLIGNFYPESKMTYKRLVPKRKVRLDRAVYLIDQVSLKPVNSRNNCNSKAYQQAIIVNINRHPYVHLFPTYPFDENIKEEIIKNDTIILPLVQFESASFTLLPQAFSALDSLAKNLMSVRNSVISIEGHTDNEGGAGYNLELSKNRAKTVANYLIVKGLDKNKIQTTGYGMLVPKSTNSNPEGRALNRRVEFIVLLNNNTTQ